MVTEEIIQEENYIGFQIIDEKSTLEQNKYKIKREPYHYRHLIHKKIISKIFQQLSSKKIRTVIHNLIKKLGFNPEKSYKIIDVSCGYDDLLIELAKKFKNSKVIGNDLCWKQLLSLPRKKKLSNLTLTTRNILSPEFCQKENYDLIICKNTLHHLPKSGQLCLLKKLVRAGKKAIIVEIENPLEYSFSSFIWNFYYRKFLKDDGLNFVYHDEFNTLLKKVKDKIPFVKIINTSLKTIKGNYLFAVIKNYKKYTPNNTLWREGREW